MPSCAYPGSPRILLCGFPCLLTHCTAVTSSSLQEPILFLSLLSYDLTHDLYCLKCCLALHPHSHDSKIINIYITQFGYITCNYLILWEKIQLKNSSIIINFGSSTLPHSSELQESWYFIIITMLLAMQTAWTLTKLIHCNRTIKNDSHTSRSWMLFLKFKTLLGLTQWNTRYIYFLNKQLFFFSSLVYQGHTLLHASPMPTTELVWFSTRSDVTTKGCFLFLIMHPQCLMLDGTTVFSTNYNHATGNTYCFTTSWMKIFLEFYPYWNQTKLIISFTL